jgi:hypothetical protein
MESSSQIALSQAVTSKTPSEYYKGLLLVALYGVFGEWIPAVGGFLLGFALRLLQDHYGYSVKSDGWFKVYWPWALAFILVCLYHAFRASWKIHHANSLQIARKRVDELFLSGQILLSEAPHQDANIDGFCRFWSEEKRRWEHRTGEVLAANFGTERQQEFFSITSLNLNESAGSVHQKAAVDYLYLNQYIKNLEQLKRTLPRR